MQLETFNFLFWYRSKNKSAVYKFARLHPLTKSIMFKTKYIKFKMKFFYCVFTTHVVSISEKKISRGTVYSIEFYHFMKKNIHSCGQNKSSKTFLNRWESMGFSELSLSKSNSISKRSSISKRNSMSEPDLMSKSKSIPESNWMSESNSLWESNSIWESNLISKRISIYKKNRYGKGIRYRNRIWYRKGTIRFRKRIWYWKRTNHKSVRREWPQWPSLSTS